METTDLWGQGLPKGQRMGPHPGKEGILSPPDSRLPQGGTPWGTRGPGVPCGCCHSLRVGGLEQVGHRLWAQTIQTSRQQTQSEAQETEGMAPWAFT